MTNTEKQALIFRLEQDKERIEKKLEWLDRQEIKARIAIYAAIRTNRQSEVVFSMESAIEEAKFLFEDQNNRNLSLLDSIEKHIEELESGS